MLGYADDLFLLANSTQEMAVLLAQVELFCARTGLELDVAETVIQGIDYANGQDLRPQVFFGGQRVPFLPARTPFKYLGCLSNMALTFRGERARILKRTREAAALIRGYQHDPTQMMELVRAAVRPLFRYSCGFVDWSLKDLEEVGKAWNRAYRAALQLGRSTSAHVLAFPTSQGGLELPTPQEILMHEQEKNKTEYFIAEMATGCDMDTLLNDEAASPPGKH